MDQDQPRADASATLDPDTIAGTQTQPYDSDTSIPSNSTNDSPVSSNTSTDEPLMPSDDTPTNPLVSSTPSYSPIVPSSDSLDTPSVVVSPGSSSPESGNPASTSPDSSPSIRPVQYTDIKPVSPTTATVSQSKPTIRDRAFKFNKTAVIATVAALSVIVAVGIGSLVLTSSGNNASLTGNNKPVTTNYKPQSLSLGNISGYNQLLTGKNQDLKVNGQLSVSNSIVLSPSTTPTSPTLGQLYYNATNNTPYLYNGKSFISLIPSVGGTIAGTDQSISLGSGLGLQGTNLANTGVTNLSGTPNQIIASASNGSIKLSLPTNLDIAGNFTTTNGLVTNSLDAGYITGNGYGITDINPNALPSTLAYENRSNTFTAPQQFKNSTNSTNAFSIQDAAGNTLLSADTTTDTLTVSNLLPEDPGVSVQGVTQNSIIADSGNDGYNDNGQWSVMGSDGFMRFVYTNWTTDTIHYVRCENTSCTSYIDQPIETDATNGLDSPTIALDQNGDPYIAYIDYTSPTNSWHIAHCVNEDCTGATTIEDLSQTNPYGYNGSIAVDGQDHADLVYDTYDYSVSPRLYSLEFIHCDNTDCSLNTDTTLASSNSNNGGNYYETSSVVTAPDGYPRVAYVNEGTDSLVYDNCSGSYDCSSYSSNVVDNGNASYWMAMAVGSDGLAKFVYEGSNTNSDNDALEYAACNDAACSTATNTQLVSGTDSYGGYGSIALTANNLPVISSYTEPDDSPPANLLYIYCSDADCTSPATKTVASLGNGGYTSNIGITGNGLPMITYIYQDNGSDASIDSVTLGDITGSAITTGTNIGSSSDTFGTVYAQSIQTNGLTSNNGELIVQSTPNSANDFTVQDASGNDLLNVNSLDDTTTLLSSNAQATTGPNLITYSDFSDDWSGNNWTLTDTTATYTGSGTDTLYDDYDFIGAGIGVYQVTLTITGDTNGGCITPAIANRSGEPICGNGSNLTEEIDVTYAGGASLTFTPDSNFNGTISGIEVQQISASSILSAGYGSTPQSAQPIFNVNTEGGVGINTTSSIPYNFYGPNLITDPNYNDGSWTGNNWTMNPTSATYTGSGGDPLTTNQFTPVPGTNYELSFDCTGDTNNGDISISIGGNGYNFGCSSGGTAIKAVNNDPLTFDPDYGNPSETFNGTISDIEVQLIYSEPVLTVQDSQNNLYADLFVANNANGNNVLTVDSQGDLTTTGAVQGNTLTLQGDNLSSTPGPNLITDPNYNDGSWTGNNWTMNPTSATYTGSGGDDLTTNQFIPTPGDEYQVTFTESGNTNDGCIGIELGGYGWNCYAEESDYTFTLNFFPNNSDPLTFIPDNPFNGTISNVSVEQLIPSNVLEVDSNGSTELSVDGDGTLTLNHLASSDSSNYLCLNSSNQVAGCNGTSGPINNGTTTQDNANFNIQSAAASDIGGVIQGASGQTADLLDLEDANGNVLDDFSSNGDLQIGTPNSSGYTLIVSSSGIVAPAIVTPEGTAGSSRCVYNIVGLNSTGSAVAPQTGGTTNTCNSSLSGSNYNQISWPAISGAVTYDVYRSFGNWGLLGSTSTTSFNDTGQTLITPNVSPPLYADGVLSSSNNPDGSPLQLQAISGNYAYESAGDEFGSLNSNSNSFQVINIANPSSPYVVNATTLDGVSGLVVSGNYLYAVTDNSLFVYDISDPANPTLLTTVSLPSGITRIEDMNFNDGYLYLLAQGSGGSSIEVFDISDPASTSLYSSVTDLGFANGAMAFEGNYLYIEGSTNANDFYVFNISDPSDIIQVTSIFYGIGYGHNASGMQAVNNYLFIATSDGKLDVINIANPSSPQFVESYTNTEMLGTGTCAPGGLNRDMSISGQTLYFGNSGCGYNVAGSVVAINISSPASPVIEGYASAGDSSAAGIIAENGYLYQSTGWASPGFLIYPIGGGGIYTQNISATNTQTSSLLVSGSENIATNSSIQGNLTVGQSIQDSGSALFQDSSNSATAFQVQNSAGANLLNVDTTNNLIRLGSSTYSTGTISQSTNTVTGSGTTFTSGMVGGTLIYSDGTSAIITGYTNATTITVSVSKTVSSGSTYQIQYSGVSVSSTGNVLLQTTTNSTTGFQIQNSSGQALLTADTSGMTITINGTLTLNGHLTTGNSSGSTTAAASSPNACTNAPTVSLTGNDTAGLITITTSSSGTCAAGDLATISFASAYSTAPNIVLSPDSASATTLQYYSNGVGTGSFKVSANNSPATNTTYKYYYHVIQ